MDAAQQMVLAWLGEHPGGTLDQMAGQLKCEYPPEYRKDMAMVLRSIMASEQMRRASAAQAGTVGEDQ